MLYLRVDKISLYNFDSPGGIHCLCSLSGDVPKWGLYGVMEQKPSGAQCFIVALGLF